MTCCSPPLSPRRPLLGMLLLAYVVAATGLPVASRPAAAGAKGSPCGRACGCGPDTKPDECCCAKPKPRPRPKPAGCCGRMPCRCGGDEEPAAPCCRVRTPAPVAVAWVVVSEAKRCKGLGPDGPPGGDPGIPPPAAVAVALAAPAPVPVPGNLSPTARPAVPPDPPPKPV